jgi:hypothetical protein
MRSNNKLKYKSKFSGKKMLNKKMVKSFVWLCLGASFVYLIHEMYTPMHEAVMAIARNNVERLIFTGVTPLAFLIFGLILWYSYKNMMID